MCYRNKAIKILSLFVEFPSDEKGSKCQKFKLKIISGFLSEHDGAFVLII